MSFWLLYEVLPLSQPINLSSSHPPFGQCNLVTVWLVLEENYEDQLALLFDWYPFESKPNANTAYV